tara:strand:+ start:394 stop:810 length:417 start_codon:yes stop_codon:yes gene_type:complete
MAIQYDKISGKPRSLMLSRQRIGKDRALYDSPKTDLMGKDKQRTANKEKAVRERLQNQSQLREISNVLRTKMQEDGVPKRTQQTRLKALRSANNTIQNADRSLLFGGTLGPLRTKVNKDLAKAFGNKTGAIPAYLRKK